MGLKKYISELKRRHVFKSAIAYLVIAWLIAQVASIVLPTFNAPPYFMKGLLFLLALGFPVNLIFAWIYDITPEGITKTKDLEAKTENSALKNRKLNRVIIASLSVAVIVLLFNQFNNKTQSNETVQMAVNETPASNNLIAVLPFLNMKSNPETDYLGFAMADQIIGSLVYLNHITVRPSSSVRQFENTTVNPTDVGKDLNVDYILSGNYLKEKDSIRLTIELIDLKNNKIVWREPVTVNFESAFQLQDIVSKKIVKGLDLQFSQTEINRINNDTPANPLAYEYYLRAVAYPLSVEGDQLAIEMLKKSISIDSLYAPSYAHYGARLHTLANYALLNPEETIKAENYLTKALSINPELLDAMSSLIMMYTETNRKEDAVKLNRKMIEINPNNARTHFNLSYIYRYVGMNEEAVMETEKALALDSKNPNFRSAMLTYTFAWKFEKALLAYNNFKESSFTTFQYGYTLFQMGKQQESVKYIKRSLELEPGGMTGFFTKAMIAIYDGKPNEAKALMKELEGFNVKDAEPWYFMAQVYGLIGDTEACNRCLRKTIAGGFFNYPLMTRDIFFDPVRQNAEFQEILELAKEKHLAFQKELF